MERELVEFVGQITMIKVALVVILIYIMSCMQLTKKSRESMEGTINFFMEMI